MISSNPFFGPAPSIPWEKTELELIWNIGSFCFLWSHFTNTKFQIFFRRCRPPTNKIEGEVTGAIRGVYYISCADKDIFLGPCEAITTPIRGTIKMEKLRLEPGFSFGILII